MLDQENLEKFTKRSKTEEVNDNIIESLEEINVEKRLSKEQKSESFNIFHNNLTMSQSSLFNSSSK